jgi:predicted TPR repeat methyltransferase
MTHEWMEVDAASASRPGADATAARQAFEQALTQRPRSGFGLYGLALCSEKNGETARAAKEFIAFLEAWKHADRSLAQIGHARAYVVQPQAHSSHPLVR